MNIPINKNIDEYKDDVYKGLSSHQLLFSALTLLLGGTAFLLSSMVFHVPMVLAVMVTIIVAMPLAVIGFMPIYGMSLPEYWRKRKKVISNSTYVYIATLYQSTESCSNGDRGRKKKRQQKKRIYLDDINEKGGDQQ